MRLSFTVCLHLNGGGVNSKNKNTTSKLTSIPITQICDKNSKILHLTFQNMKKSIPKYTSTVTKDIAAEQDDLPQSFGILR